MRASRCARTVSLLVSILAAQPAASELCLVEPTAHPRCGAFADVLLVVQASSGVDEIHDQLSTLIRTFIRSYQLQPVSDAATSTPMAGTPRVGLITYNVTAEAISPLTADSQALESAVASRLPSGGQTCTSCGSQLARETLLADARPGSFRHVVLIVGSTQNVQGIDL